MITGRFGDTSGRPFIEARLYLPRLNLSGDVSFLLDTGADASILMPADAKRLGLPFNQLEGDNECGGLGGTVHCFVERALLVFSDPKKALYAYELDIDIMHDDPQMEDVPSIVGRDVIDRWRITYDPSHSKLQVVVRSADMTFDIKPAIP